MNLEELQTRFAQIDVLSKKPSNSKSRLLEILLMKKEVIKIKMYQEPHATPHFHVDYGPQNHIASYGIDAGERIAGSLPKKYDKIVTDWTLKNRDNLMSTWNDLQAGGTGTTFVIGLSNLGEALNG